jgi:glutamate:Na+ symporter, ESS family
MTDLPAATPIAVSGFVALTFGIIAYFAGAWLTQRYRVLAAYSIPEPVTGGLAAAVLVLLVYLATGRAVAFDLAARDALLVYFFTTIGLNARLDDLRRGGPVLLTMLALTVDLHGLSRPPSGWAAPGCSACRPPPASCSAPPRWSAAMAPRLPGGRRSPTLHGVAGAAELGIAMATMGLIVASLMGGPIAKFLIARHELTPPHDADELVPTAAAP